jgi:hypothetical protein
MIDQHIIICVGIDHTTHSYPTGYFDHSVAHFRKLYTPLGLGWWVTGNLLLFFVGDEQMHALFARK